ncbi:hypothetical protein ACSSS7_003648 [Eimeria intestinalis]
MGSVLPDAGAEAGQDSAAVEELKRQYEEELEANRRALQEMTTSWQDKLNAERQKGVAVAGRDDKENLTVPYLSNLNEDPFLSGKLIFPLQEGQSTFGKPGGSEKTTFNIGGLGVVEMHATLEVKKLARSRADSDDVEYEVVLTAQGKTSVNGETLHDGGSRHLVHKDRIVFGHSNMYVFVDPADMDKSLPTWEDGMKDLTKDVLVESTSQQSPEAARAEKKYQEKWERLQADVQLFESEKKELLRKLKEKEAVVLASEEDQIVAQNKLKQIAAEKRAVQQELNRKEEELKTRRLLFEKEKADEAKRQDAERAAHVFLEEVMAKTHLLVAEANGYAQELGVGVYFSMKLSTQSDNAATLRSTICGTSLQHTEIVIQVQRVDSDIVQIWNLDLFEKKIFEMRELYAQRGAGANREFSLKDGLSDPFAVDMESYQVIGEAFIYLDVIRCLFSVDKEVFPVIDSNGKICGKLTISIAVSLANGNMRKNTEEANPHLESGMGLDDFHSVEDIHGQELNLVVTVLYRWLDGETAVSMTSLERICRNPVYNNCRSFDLLVDDELIEKLNGALIFEVRGKIVEKKPKTKSKNERSDKQRSTAQLKKELEESERTLEQVGHALDQRGIRIEDLIGRI